MERRPKIRHVADLAGVAPSTVSVVLNEVDGARVSDDTRRRVVQAAEQLGYAPDAMARALRTQRSHTMGFLSDVIATTPHAGQLVQGAQDAAWRAGMLLLLLNTGSDAQHEQEAIRTLLHRRVDGIVYATMYHRVVEVPRLRPTLPLVLLDARGADRAVPSVVPDDVAGAAAGVTELLAHGHRRVGFATDRDDVPAAEERLRGYREALAAHGVPFDPELVVRDESSTRGGRRAVTRLLDFAQPPTAVFCFTDSMAMGAYQVAAERGLRIPDDLSVVGYDDQELIAPALSPALTTVALPHYEMGVWAVETLLGLIGAQSDAPAHAPIQMRMPCPLIRRESVGPPPAGDSGARAGPRGWRGDAQPP